MNGVESVTYKLARITFQDYYFNPEFKDITALEDKEVAWGMGVDSRVVNINKNQDALTIIITLTLTRQSDKIKIAELITESTYHVNIPLSFWMKNFTFNVLVNQTLGHAQGGWSVKNKSSRIASMLPQGYDRIKQSGINWEEHIYETWD